MLFFNVVTSAFICSDIPPSERVDCGIDGVDEDWCLKEGCCFRDTNQTHVPKCYYKAGGISKSMHSFHKIRCCSSFVWSENSTDIKHFVFVDRRKMLTSVRPGMFDIRFDSKEYKLTPKLFYHDQLAAECAAIGPEYKPAYINYNEEYEM